MKWSELPQEYKDLEKWFPNYAKCGIDINYNSDELLYKFVWNNTPQRHRFWAQCLLAKDVSELPQIPGNESNKS